MSITQTTPVARAAHTASVNTWQRGCSQPGEVSMMQKHVALCCLAIADANGHQQVSRAPGVLDGAVVATHMLWALVQVACG